MEKADLILDCKNALGEGILWNDEESCLYWTDIEGKLLYRYEPESGKLEKYPQENRLCSFAFREKGGLLMAFDEGIALCAGAGEKPEWIHRIRRADEGIRLNDGRCDRDGRFIVGEFDPEEKSRGLAYRIEDGRAPRELFGGLDSANSTCFSPDGKTMYHSCAVAEEIWAFDYDRETGRPSGKRLFAGFDDQPGLPDGSVVDAEGCLWNAQWGGSRVVRFSPDGSVDRVCEMPVKNITCLCFGGKELDTLYVTTARLTLGDKELADKPLSGGLFALKPGVKGLKEGRYRG